MKVCKLSDVLDYLRFNFKTQDFVIRLLIKLQLELSNAMQFIVK